MTLIATVKPLLRRNIIAKAASHLGHEEMPRYSNSDNGGFIDQANAYVGNAGAHAAWCCAAACYIVGMAAEQMGLHFSDTLLVKTGYCPSEYTHAKALGTAIDPAAVVHGSAEVLAGDLLLVFYDREDGGKLPHHVGIVEVPPSKGKPAFTTLEGNTLPDGFQGDESRGFGYFRKHRNALDKNPSGHAHYVFVRTV